MRFDHRTSKFYGGRSRKGGSILKGLVAISYLASTASKPQKKYTYTNQSNEPIGPMFALGLVSVIALLLLIL